VEYKPDFEEMIPRMEAWWNGGLLHRVSRAVTAPEASFLVPAWEARRRRMN